MKYGDVVLADRRWGRNGVGYPQHTYRFRCDPVPFVWGPYRGFYCWYKRPKTTQERRMSYFYGEYVRPKRRNHNLPNAWDDWRRSDIRTRRSWKNKKIRKQWMKKNG